MNTIVIGGGRGIGAAIARKLGTAGSRVVVNYLRRDADAASVVRDIEANGGAAASIRCDARDEHAARSLIEQAIEFLGGVDAVVHCAHTPFRPSAFEELSWNHYVEQLEGTLKPAIICNRLLLPHFKRSGRGAVLHLSSATVGYGTADRFIHRTMAKAALEELTRGMAAELGPHGIRVNGLSIGWTETCQFETLDSGLLESVRGRIPMQRFATPDEIASTAVFLLSPEASYVTGTVFPVTGGLNSSPR